MRIDPSGHADCDDMPWECEETGGYFGDQLDWKQSDLSPGWQKDHLIWYITQILGFDYHPNKGIYVNDKAADTDSLEIMAKIIDRAAAVYGDSWESGILETLTELFTGVPQYGFGTLDAASETSALIKLGSAGFHSDFDDGSNQVRHYWSHVANSIDFSGVGYAFLEAIVANHWHEVVQHSTGTGDFHASGAGPKDYALSIAGWQTGLAISSNSISPSQLADYVRNTLGQGSPGSYGYVDRAGGTCNGTNWCQRPPLFPILYVP